MNTREETTGGFGSRKAAISILSQVLRRKRPLDLAAAEVLSKSELEPRDQSFARAIASASLRHFGRLEALIRAFVPKAPPPHKAGPTLEILLAGSAELLFLGVPPHAAVDGANRMARADPKAVHFRPLINAVLRRVAQEGQGVLKKQDTALVNTPDWLFERWRAVHGEEKARCIACAHLEIPPLDLALKSANDPYTDFSDALLLAPGHLRLRDAGRVESLPGFADGRWWVQDFAASLPATLLGDVRGKPVLDLCAAPGGKTLQLAAAGAHVTSVDLAPERLALVDANLMRTHLSAELVAADVRDWKPESLAPFVLLDAPCLATGTIRRHPDLPWIKSAADLVNAESLQHELLEAAAGMTTPGGILVYAVCSLEAEEGVEQIEAFLARHEDFKRQELNSGEVLDDTFITEKGDLKTLPSYWSDRGGMDGFYAARLRRLF